MRGGLGFLGVGGLGAEPGNLMYFLFHRMMLRLTSPSFVRPSGVAMSIYRSAKYSTMSSTMTRAYPGGIGSEWWSALGRQGKAVPIATLKDGLFIG